MAMQGKIVSRDGHLFVLYETALDAEPTLKFMWWPIETTTGNPWTASRPAEGDTAVYRGNGTWGTWTENGTRSTGSVSTGPGDTQAAHVSYVSAPAPKVRGKETRWHQGRWQKLLKRGWVDA